MNSCQTCSKPFDKPYKTFCDINCKKSFSYLLKKDTEILKDISLLFDKNGSLSKPLKDKHLNIATVEFYKNKVLEIYPTYNIEDTNTIFYILEKSIIPKRCKVCQSVLKMPYRPKGVYNYCSNECRNSCTDYASNLSTKKKGVSRKHEEFLGDWFRKKMDYLKDSNIEPLYTYEDYKSIKENKLYRCKVCDYKFEAGFYGDRPPICRRCNPNSKEQTHLFDFISSLGINDISINDRKQIKPRELDLYLNNERIGIEYDGFYWHHNKNDYSKYELCGSKGIRLIKIFEDEFYNKRSIVESRIRNILKKNDRRIFARKCYIKEINVKTAREFIDSNHIQGYCNSAIKIGLFLENELVSVMTFGKPRFTKKYQYELIRFCSIKNTSVIGSASKMFKYFIKEYNPTSILSYCDIRWGTGNVYENLGFKFIGKTKENYFWVKNKKRYSRIMFQKHKLKSLFPQIYSDDKTEDQILEENNFLKIYDLGNLKYEWRSNVRHL